MIGITFMFGFANTTNSTENTTTREQAISSKAVKKNFDAFIVPGNICIVNTDGVARTFNSCAHECLNKKHSWFKISIGEDPFKYK